MSRIITAKVWTTNRSRPLNLIIQTETLIVFVSIKPNSIIVYYVFSTTNRLIIKFSENNKLLPRKWLAKLKLGTLVRQASQQLMHA